MSSSLCSVRAAGWRIPLFAVLALLAVPAHAFIAMSTTGLVFGLLMLAWPWVLPVFLVMLVLQWRRRREQPKRLIVTSIVFLLGMAIWLSAMVPMWRESLHRASVDEAWREIDKAVAERQHDQALKLLSENPYGNAYTYLERLIDHADGAAPVGFAKVLFAQCVGLQDPTTGSFTRDLLAQAIEKGQFELVTAWLDSQPCAPPGIPGREQVLLDNFYWLIPSVPSEDDSPDLAVRQAESLKALVQRYPALLGSRPIEDCMSNVRPSDPCSLVSLAFAKQHLPVVQALVPLDERLEEHLPLVVAHVLRNDVSRSREAASRDVDAVHHWMPALFATAPIEALRAALEAIPFNEQMMMDGNAKNTQFQLLHPIVEAAESRDRDRLTWDFLNLLLDMFPTQLARLDTSLVDYYGRGPAVDQPQGRALMKRLRAAGISCQALQGMVSWGSAERAEGTEAMVWVDCKPPEDWRPYEPSPPR